MASGHLCKLHSLLSRLSYGATLRHVRTCLVPVRQKSIRPPLDDPNCPVEIGVTSDGKTVVCYHPTVDIPYELTQVKPREDQIKKMLARESTVRYLGNNSDIGKQPDPLSNAAETHDQVLKAHLSKEVLKDKKGPTIEELSKMFFTTKHRWYPVGQYHMRRRKKDSPKDR